MDDLEKALQGKGTWVKAEDMPPSANVWRRVYRKRDGSMGTFYGTLTEQPEAWFYPDEDEEAA